MIQKILLKTKNTLFLAAWGSDKRINKYNNYSEIINKKFKGRIRAIAINNNDTPTHPCPMPKNRIAMSSFFKGNKQLETVELKSNSSEVILS